MQRRKIRGRPIRDRNSFKWVASSLACMQGSSRDPWSHPNRFWAWASSASATLFQSPWPISIWIRGIKLLYCKVQCALYLSRRPHCWCCQKGTKPYSIEFRPLIRTSSAFWSAPISQDHLLGPSKRSWWMSWSKCWSSHQSRSFVRPFQTCK